jgi:hypothetical protein
MDSEHAALFVRISVFWVLSKLVKLLMQSFHHVLYIIIINQCNTICTAFLEILTGYEPGSHFTTTQLKLFRLRNAAQVQPDRRWLLQLQMGPHPYF